MKNLFVPLLLSILLQACGGGSGGSSPTVPSQPSGTQQPNQLPVISAANQSAVEGQEITVSASVSDADGSISRYEWLQLSGPAVSFSQPNGPTLTFEAPEVEVESEVVFTLEVEDNEGGISRTDITITIGVNDTPTIVASEQSVQQGQAATVEVDTSDSIGGIVSFVWEQVTGQSVSNLVVDGNRISFDAPEVSQDLQLQFRLTVTDAYGATAESLVSILVEAPAYAFQLSGSSDPSLFADSSVEVTFGDKKLETQTDADGNFNVAVTAQANEADDLIRVRINSSARPRFVVAGILDTVERRSSINQVADINAMTTALLSFVDRQGEYRVRDEDYDSAEESLYLLNVYRGALALELLFNGEDESDDLPRMSERFADSLDFLLDNEATATLANQYQENFLGLYERIESDFYNNVLVDVAITASGEQRHWNLTNAGFWGGLDAFRITLNPDQSAQFVSEDGTFDFTWRQNSLQTQLLADGQQLTNISYTCTFASRQCNTYLRSAELKTISTGIDRNIVFMRVNSETMVVEDDGSETLQSESSSNHLLWQTDTLLDVPSTLTLGQEFAFRAPTVSNDVETGSESYPTFSEFSQGGYVTLLGDWQTGGDAIIRYPAYVSGTQTELASELGAWSLSEQGEVVITTTSETHWQTLVLSLVDQRNGQTQVIIEGGIDGGNVATTSLLYQRDSLAVELTQAELVGIYQWNYGAVRGAFLKFWFELNEDGTATTYSSEDSNADGVLDADEVIVMPGHWQMDESGKVLIRRYRNGSGYCTSVSFEPAENSDCRLYNEREWDLMKVIPTQNGEQAIHLYQQHKFFYWFNDQELTPLQSRYFPNTLQRLTERPLDIN